ncbi:TPA: YfdX family protein, partial [Escherichia coli]|nr:YfdX family protein [Escherichia coli]
MNDIENIAITGNEVMQDVQLARVMLFNGNTSKAREFLLDANKKINDDGTDWQRFIQQDKK